MFHALELVAACAVIVAIWLVYRYRTDLAHNVAHPWLVGEWLILACVFWVGFHSLADGVLGWLEQFLDRSSIDWLNTRWPWLGNWSPSEVLRGGAAFVATAVVGVLTLPKVGRILMWYGSKSTRTTIREYPGLSKDKHWMIYLIDLVGIINTPKREHTIYVTPRGYMRLHTAAAYLLGNNFASLYKGPPRIWDILHEDNIDEFYPRIISKKRLRTAIRFVQFSDDKGTQRAISDFQSEGAAPMDIYKLKQGLIDIDDFSAFGHGSGSIVIRIHDDDRDLVAKGLQEIADKGKSVAVREKSLEKLRFRAVVRFFLSEDGNPYPPRIQDYIERLQEMAHAA